jgi:hypothetical protein
VPQKYEKQRDREKHGAGYNKLLLPWKETAGMEELFPANNLLEEKEQTQRFR